MSRVPQNPEATSDFPRRLDGRVSRKSLIHVIAECTVCGKHWEDYMTAQKLAAAHARKTGHKVRAELGYVVEYGA